jgi:hypothetical protein
MRKDGNGIAGQIRRAVMRLVAPGTFLGLAVAGAAGPDPAAIQVSVRLRGPQDMDGGALLALGRRLRKVLRLAPDARLPVLVIRWLDRDEAEASGENLPGAPPRQKALPKAKRAGVLAQGGKAAVVRSAGVDWPNATALPMPFQDGCCEALQKERRRSRSPPSPGSVLGSACG